MRRSDRQAPGQRRQQGLTLFELVVFILVVAIIFAAGFNRFRDYPGAAERANFLSVNAQLRAGVNMQMMNAIARGEWHELQSLDGSNPMDLMLEPPSNYVGAFSIVEENTMPRRVWYFDRSAGELVYLANDAEQLFALRGGNHVPADRIRLRIRSVHEERPANAEVVDSGTSEETEARGNGAWQGLVLEPVIPYDWQSMDLRLPQ